VGNHSNFITPPDFITEDSEDFDNETVIVIDADWLDVEQLATYCKSCNTSYNVYLYSSEMDNLTWLHDAERKASAIIINMSSSSLTQIKDKWAEKPHAYFYGPKAPLKNREHQLNKLTDYFTLNK
jgi:hypothetical protein